MTVQSIVKKKLIQEVKNWLENFQFFSVFLVLVLLSAHTHRSSVSSMQDFSYWIWSSWNYMWWFIQVYSWGCRKQRIADIISKARFLPFPIGFLSFGYSKLLPKIKLLGFAVYLPVDDKNHFLNHPSISFWPTELKTSLQRHIQVTYSFILYNQDQK